MASKLSDGASGAAKSSAGSTISSKSTGTAKSSSSSSTSSKSSTSSTKSSTSSTKSSSLSKGSSGASKAVPQSLSSGGSNSSGGGSTRSTTVTPRDTNSLTPRLMESLSKSSRDTAASSTAAAKAATAGKNLRGAAVPGAKSSALAVAAKSTQKQLDQSRASPNPPGTEWMTWGMFDDYVNSDAFGKPASVPEAVSPLEAFLQGPYERRVERAGGAPFEGPVDWEGIGAAIFGGQSAAERDAALLAGRTGYNPGGRYTGPGSAAAVKSAADPNSYSPLNVTEPFDWAEFNAYTNSEAFGKPQVDPQTGFIRDPETGTYYRPDLLPSEETRLAENPIASQLPSFAPLEGLIAGIQAEGDRWNSADASLPPMPRPRPAYAPQGIDAMAVPLPGQTEGGAPIEIEVRGGNGIEESDEARYARENPVAEPKKKTVFDQVVEGAGGLLESTALGGAVKTLFPDVWYGAGESIKSMDDGLTYGGGNITGPGSTWFEYMAQNGSLSEQSPGGYYPPPPPFPDANHNGIDDRLEGFTGGVSWGTRTAQFPNMPPYDPGRSNEWKYFTGPGYAEGGEVDASAQDPRMNLIADAEDVLEDIAAGQPPSPDDAEILKAFVAQFGDDALRALNDQVKGGMKMRGKRDARMVEGPGTGTSDSIPAVIDGNQPAALSDGEFVIPAAAVAAAGKGDREKGAAQLQALSDMLVSGGK
jgi:hypothetical protein